MIEKMKELSLLIDKASEIFYSGVDWKIKYDVIFTMGVGSKIIEAGFDFNWYDPDTSYEEDVTYYFRALQDFQKGMKLLYTERLKGAEMRPNNFPQASDYSALVEAKRIKNQKLVMSEQLSTISKALTNFADKCDGEGVIKISEEAIGVAIFGQNAKKINDAGWDFRKVGINWLFYIKWE